MTGTMEWHTSSNGSGVQGFTVQRLGKMQAYKYGFQGVGSLARQPLKAQIANRQRAHEPLNCEPLNRYSISTHVLGEDLELLFAEPHRRVGIPGNQLHSPLQSLLIED
jgi:hypothetical protein